MRMFKITLHFKTGTKQVVKAREFQLTKSGHGIERIRIEYLPGQGGDFERTNIAAVFVEEITPKEK